MKKIFSIMIGAGMAFTMVSCGTAYDSYGYGNQYPSQYPSGNVIIYRTPDGGTYRTGQIYRDRNGNVYQNGRVIRTGDVYGRPGIITVYSGNSRQLPPGQAKKIYGGSAKDYAPGQVKKRGYYYDGKYRDYNNKNYKKYKKHREDD